MRDESDDLVDWQAGFTDAIAGRPRAESCDEPCMYTLGYNAAEQMEVPPSPPHWPNGQRS